MLVGGSLTPPQSAESSQPFCVRSGRRYRRRVSPPVLTVRRRCRPLRWPCLRATRQWRREAASADVRAFSRLVLFAWGGSFTRRPTPLNGSTPFRFISSPLSLSLQSAWFDASVSVLVSGSQWWCRGGGVRATGRQGPWCVHRLKKPNLLAIPPTCRLSDDTCSVTDWVTFWMLRTYPSALSPASEATILRRGDASLSIPVSG